jgi:hypothetical protein
MNLERHLRVLWRYKIVVAVGLLLAFTLAFMASFDVASGGMKRRGTQIWSSNSQVLVTQKGFPWGRVTLPSASIDTTGTTDAGATTTDNGSGPDHIQYADPTRFVNLALLYSVISYSDQVRSKLPEHPRADQISAMPLDPTNSGQSFLPIITLTTKAATPEKAIQLNRDTYKGLRDLLVSEQTSNDIPAANRVLLNVLSSPQKPVIEQGYSLTSSMLAFILCLIATLAFVHVLEALRLAKIRRNDPRPLSPQTGSHVPVVPTAATNGHHQHEPALTPAGVGTPPPPSQSSWR